MSPARTITLEEWRQLLAVPGVREQYERNVHRRSESQCAFWLGAISDSGHGKLRVGSRKAGPTRVVSAHSIGYGLAHDAEALAAIELVRHTCDSPSCQNPRHWIEGSRKDNALDYASRSRLIGHALADTRGPAGRARAIRDAILAALADQADVEVAIATAIREGQPGGAEQQPLW